VISRRLSLLCFAPLVVAAHAGCSALLGVEPLAGDTDAGAIADAGADDASDVTDAASSDANHCAPAWVDASGGFVPNGAIPNKPIDDASVVIYVCRTSVGSDWIPGKLLPGYGCYHGDGMVEQFAGDYQALIPGAACDVAWKPSPGGVAPTGAFESGHDSQGTLFACRVTEPAVDVYELGHMGWGTNHQCVYSLSGMSLTSTVFEVLTVQ
jgi:hypothetical protein